MSNYQGDPFALMQYMTPMTKGGVQGRTDDMQNLLSLIMNPQYGVAQGSYDYMQSVPPQGEQYSTPTLSSFLNSASPVWRLVAEKIMNGTIDPINAMGEIQNVLKYSDVPDDATGIDITTARAYVDKMFAEVDGMKKTDDSNAKAQKAWLESTPYGKAGLPQPTEDYNLNTVPQQENTRQAYFDYLKSEEPTRRPNALWGNVLKSVGAEFVPQSKNDPMLSDVARSKLKDDSWQRDRYLALLQADLDSILASGRNPLSDALNARNSGLF